MTRAQTILEGLSIGILRLQINAAAGPSLIALIMGLYLPLTSLTRSSCSKGGEGGEGGSGVEGEEDSNSRRWTLISRAGAAWIDKLEICTGSGASIIIGYPLCRLWKPFREMIFSDYLHGYTRWFYRGWSTIRTTAGLPFKRSEVFFLPLLLLFSFFLFGLHAFPRFAKYSSDVPQGKELINSIRSTIL